MINFLVNFVLAKITHVFRSQPYSLSLRIPLPGGLRYLRLLLTWFSIHSLVRWDLVPVVLRVGCAKLASCTYDMLGPPGRDVSRPPT